MDIKVFVFVVGRCCPYFRCCDYRLSRLRCGCCGFCFRRYFRLVRDHFRSCRCLRHCSLRSGRFRWRYNHRIGRMHIAKHENQRIFQFFHGAGYFFTAGVDDRIIPVLVRKVIPGLPVFNCVGISGLFQQPLGAFAELSCIILHDLVSQIPGHVLMAVIEPARVIIPAVHIQRLSHQDTQTADSHAKEHDHRQEEYQELDPKGISFHCLPPSIL